MINFVFKNVQSIIVAIVLVIIIEMLLPENSNKKYVKIVSGIYLLITILNPFIELFNKDFKWDFLEEIRKVENSYVNKNEIQKYYANSLNETIKNELKEKGYDVRSVEIELSSDYSQILKIIIKGIYNFDRNEITDFIMKNYSIDSDKIFFS